MGDDLSYGLNSQYPGSVVPLAMFSLVAFIALQYYWLNQDWDVADITLVFLGVKARFKNQKDGGKFLVSPDLPSPRLHPPSIRGTRLVPMFCHKSAIHRPGWLYSQYRIQYNCKCSKVCVSVFHIAWRLMQSLTCVSHTKVDKPYRGSFATF